MLFACDNVTYETGASDFGGKSAADHEIEEGMHSGGRKGGNPRKHGLEAQARNNRRNSSASNPLPSANGFYYQVRSGLSPPIFMVNWGFRVYKTPLKSV